MVVRKYKSEEVEAQNLKAGMIVRMLLWGKHSNLTAARAAEAPVFGYVMEFMKTPYSTYVTVNWRTGKDGKNMVWQLENVPCAPEEKWEILTGTMRGVISKAYLESAKVNFDKRVPGATFNVGADPEFFIEAAGKMIPAFDFLPANNRTNFYMPYWDGPQGEFRVGVGTCLDGLVTNIRNGLATLQQHAEKHNKDARISMRSVMDTPLATLAGWKKEHSQFGCMPSMNVYGVVAPGSSVDPLMVPFRPAGGHMHFGNTSLHRPEVYNPVVRMLDAVIGVGCVSMFAKMDDPRRRELYGLAGEFRLPKHGLEYRTLSNAWLTHPGVVQLIWDTARVVVRAGMVNLRYVWDATDQEVQDAINHTDVKLARELLKRNEELLGKILRLAYSYDGARSSAGREQGKKAFMEGVETVVKDPFDLVGNWALGKNNQDNTSLTLTRYITNCRWTSLAYSVVSSHAPQ